MTIDRSERQVETTVQFLNVDIELFGTFDRPALLRGFGDAIVVLHRGTDRPGEPSLSFELNTPGPTFPSTVSELMGLVRALPDEARRAWDSAARRVFSIGIQAGLTPASTEWTFDTEMMKTLVAIDVELSFTVYGANIGARGDSGSSRA